MENALGRVFGPCGHVQRSGIRWSARAVSAMPAGKGLRGAAAANARSRT